MGLVPIGANSLALRDGLGCLADPLVVCLEGQGQ